MSVIKKEIGVGYRVAEQIPWCLEKNQLGALQLFEWIRSYLLALRSCNHQQDVFAKMTMLMMTTMMKWD